MAVKAKCGKCGAELLCHCPVCEGAAGGKKAARRMTTKERAERARKAAQARWKPKAAG